MIKKSIKPPKELLELHLPKYSKEQKIVEKVLRILDTLGEPKFSVTENRFKTYLKAKDEASLWYAKGLLESLLFEEGEKDGNN